jgi:hypothetical protein
MMTTILIIVIGCFVIAMIGVYVFLIKMYREIMLKMLGPASPKILESFKDDHFISEIMKYALDKGLNCSIRPGLNNKLTMYYRDETDGNEYSVTELFTVEGDSESLSWKKGYEELTIKIDKFIDNKQLIKDKIKEEKNATN